ncbi:hypothetical protein GCM10009810_00790 [Nostocoides vanveenii]|uniref:Uncharacterized protein n=1 Tax=Nostocoides vanveenii TaxID=330835 RepID=A0ABN2JYR5_9MICO
MIADSSGWKLADVGDGLTLGETVEFADEMPCGVGTFDESEAPLAADPPVETPEQPATSKSSAPVSVSARRVQNVLIPAITPVCGLEARFATAATATCG